MITTPVISQCSCGKVERMPSILVTAHQPCYLPWVGYFAKAARSNVLVVLDDVAFSKGDWAARNKIRTATGWTWLSVPVLTSGRLGQKLHDVEIDATKHWALKHWKAIEANYGRAPYYAIHRPFFEDTFHREWKMLIDLDMHLVRYLLSQLDISTPVVRASESARVTSTSSQRLIDITRMMGGDAFVFGGEGEDYADVTAFRRAGITPIFQRYRHPVYQQAFPGFEPFMSVIDLLFNHGPRAKDILLAEQDPLLTTAGETA